MRIPAILLLPLLTAAASLPTTEGADALAANLYGTYKGYPQYGPYGAAVDKEAAKYAQNEAVDAEHTVKPRKDSAADDNMGNTELPYGRYNPYNKYNVDTEHTADIAARDLLHVPPPAQPNAAGQKYNWYGKYNPYSGYGSYGSAAEAEAQRQGGK